MQTTRELNEMPFEVLHEEHLRIPMPDGIELAARIWRPRSSDSQPVPAILEYIPYRRRDLTRARDAVMHPYFAGHGYVSVRVDMRGSGDSDGVLPDEYTQQELDDGCAVLRWLAAQPWCDGRAGMIGISWGGFNGLQIAAMRPPELKAVVAVCATDDRYADDVHYMGGCLLGDNLSWAATMFAYDSLPPDPQIVGERWRDMWRERLEAIEPWAALWLRHQHRDEYWQHGSVCEDWDAIQCPVLTASGWADGYSNAVFRLMEHLKVPRMGLIGPWSHKYPHQGVPGPAIGFLQEVLRWWDHWLKDRDTGIMKEPMLRTWLQDPVPPVTRYEERPGRWVGETAWPSPEIATLSWRLAPRSHLAAESETVEAKTLSVQSPLTVGLFAGKWCSYAATPDLPHDQREEDGGALVFESDPLETPLEILGLPEVELTLSVDKPVAMVAVRLSDVAPDDKATRVTYGLLNLCQRESRESPEPLAAGERCKVRIPMNGCAQHFPAGHRLRLSISTSYWPLAWLPPESVRLSIVAGESRLTLPVRETGRNEPGVSAFQPPEGAPPIEITPLDPPHHNWWVKRDLAEDVSTLEVINDSGSFRIEEIDLEVKRRTLEWYTTRADDFSSARGETRSNVGFSRGDWRVETETHTIMTCDRDWFYIHAQLDAYEDSKRICARNWDIRIPRELV